MIKKFLIQIIILSFIFLYCNIIHATEAYDFATDTIRSLQLCIIANRNFNDLALEETKEPDETGLTLAIALTTHKKYMDKASLCIEPYTSSHDGLIIAPSEYILSIYKNINRNTDDILELSEDINNNPEKYLEKLGTFNRRFGEMGAERIALWKQLPEGMTLVAYCLLDLSTSNETVLMRISPKELWALKSQLIEVFGDSIKSGIDGDRPTLEATARIFYDFLNQNWKHVEEETGT